MQGRRRLTPTVYEDNGALMPLLNFIKVRRRSRGRIMSQETLLLMDFDMEHLWVGGWPDFVIALKLPEKETEIRVTAGGYVDEGELF